MENNTTANTANTQSNDPWSTYSGGSGVFKYGVNDEVGVKEWSINQTEKDNEDGSKFIRKQLVLTYFKDNPNNEEGFSKMLHYIDYPQPKRGTTEISAGAFRMLLTMLKKQRLMILFVRHNKQLLLKQDNHLILKM